jgi:hypothetical protein
MVKKFNEMFENSLDKRIDDLLKSTDDLTSVKKNIMDEIKNAYKVGFEYAWTQGKNIHTTNQERREREQRQFNNEIELRFEEFSKTGKNYKSGSLLYQDPSLQTKYDWLRDKDRD